MGYGKVFQILSQRLQRLVVPNFPWLVLEILRFNLYFLVTGRLYSLLQKTSFKKTELPNGHLPAQS